MTGLLNKKKRVYGTVHVCVENCSEYNYEQDGWCYSISNNSYSEIHLTISGSGINQIINEDFNPIPSEI